MRIDSLKLYHFPATRSARVKWILYETYGNGFEEEIVSLYEAGQNTPEFLQFNPNHNVPVLQIGWEDGSSQHMLESAAMVAFMADSYPEKNLAPLANKPSRERADYQQMLHFGGSWMDMMLWQIRVQEHLLPQKERDTATSERYRQKFATEVEPQLTDRLEKGQFICGENFTAADCVIGHNVGWARMYGMCQNGVFKDYIRALASRPAYQAAFADARSFRPKPPKGSPVVDKFTG